MRHIYESERIVMDGKEEQARGCKRAGSRSRNNNRTKMYTIYN